MVLLCIKKVNILSENFLVPEINKEKQRKSGIIRKISSIFKNSTNYPSPEILSNVLVVEMKVKRKI